MLKKKITYLGIILFFIVVLAFGAYKLMNARDYQLFGKIISHIDTTEKVVALTFDDGPTKNVSTILTLLDDYDAKATFFLIGKDLEENLEEGKKIVNAGHQIGNHTYSHKRMVFKSPTFYKNEIEKTDELIKSIGYPDIPPVRPPYGKKLIGFPLYLSKTNHDTITWNLEPDSFYSTPDEKINYVKEHIQSGSIILMHPMYDNTDSELQAIEGILQSLTEDGYRFVTIKELQDKSENLHK
ncbi:polysaccharide deacetylase family protein [Lysinibacillus pakistanensis]|uniref:Polysaccharide deacetylase family protein n=1 Tax=Lysinibacillus pakistanensis TaxID=759811 RepID=A0AAX3WTN2_9BACI|nr:polysaccharide deacetylase family protein [Lysinibacillus pakistanensis]MDM5234502.1 polysaccharide deacetylase family protein [Lysinibacillus pakistanensis]WHY45080.1 polysaccharide deacetylase family protein [Lysinibacillus pakistanensis]WHY50089.1 polysaccharide deacetylase family protein [Lysinibacillus pakistanensis]